MTDSEYVINYYKVKEILTEKAAKIANFADNTLLKNFDRMNIGEKYNQQCQIKTPKQSNFSFQFHTFNTINTISNKNLLRAETQSHESQRGSGESSESYVELVCISTQTSFVESDSA